MTEDERKRLGATIRAKREAHGWSQKELARAAQVSQSDISEIENGQGNPTLDKIQRLARALESNLRSLFND